MSSPATPSKEKSGFQTIRVIGNGAFGAVYLVRESKTGAVYAMKIVKCSLMNEHQKQYLMREIDIMRKAIHPALLRLVGFRLPSDDDPTATILTEYMSNGSLFEMLERERAGTAPPEWNATTKTKIVLGIAAGMRYLHSLDIIHRDLKSENILLDENFEAKIGDFGLSKVTQGVDPKSNTQRLGTPLYMAPELFQNAPYDHKIDVYAFAMLTFEIVTTINPFADMSNPMALGMKIVQGVRPEIPETCPEVYRKLIDVCWAQEPSQRPEFTRIVEQLLEDEYVLPGCDVQAVKEYCKKMLPEMNQVTYEMLCSLQDYFKLRMDRLDEALKHKTSEIDALKKMVVEQGELFASERKAMHEAIDELKAQNATLANENKELRRMVESAGLCAADQLRAEVSTHGRRLDGYKQDIQNAGMHLESLHRDTDSMKKTVSALKRQNEELMGDVKAMKNRLGIQTYSSVDSIDSKLVPVVEGTTETAEPILKARESPVQLTRTVREKRARSQYVSPNKPTRDIEFWSKPFNGICSYLSQTQEGKNICDVGLLKITGNSYNELDEAKLPHLVDYSWADSWGSAFSDDSWLMFDFVGRKVSVCAYTLKTSASPPGSQHLRSWVLEGSDDASTWQTLDEVNGDNHLNGVSKVSTFQCKYRDKPACRYVRLIQTGPSHDGSCSGFALTNIEFFGSVV